MKTSRDEFIFDVQPAEKERLSSVIHLAETCNYDVDHTHRVTQLALRLFDELTSVHNLGIRERNWLEYAALLHDIGWIEGQKNHHKVALRIILTTPMLPFDSKERLIIGSIARYHRRALPSLNHDHFATLNPEEQQIVQVLASLLRLADGMDLTLQNRFRELTCKVTKRRIVVNISVQKILPKEDLPFNKKGDLFELVFQRKLVLTYKKSHRD